MDAAGGPADRPGTSYAAMASPSGLTMIAGYADGIGPNKVMVIPRATLGRLGKPTALVRDAHAAGLKVHPWTFRRENYFLPLGDKASINPASSEEHTSELQSLLRISYAGFCL